MVNTWQNANKYVLVVVKMENRPNEYIQRYCFENRDILVQKKTFFLIAGGIVFYFVIAVFCFITFQ